MLDMHALAASDSTFSAFSTSVAIPVVPRPRRPSAFTKPPREGGVATERQGAAKPRTGCSHGSVEYGGEPPPLRGADALFIFSERDSRNSRNAARRTRPPSGENVTIRPETHGVRLRGEGSRPASADGTGRCIYSEDDSRNSRNAAWRTLRRLPENVTIRPETTFDRLSGEGSWPGSAEAPRRCIYSEGDSRNSRNAASRTSPGFPKT